jgi:DNA-binding NarL/FixJ family response regulator
MPRTNRPALRRAAAKAGAKVIILTGDELDERIRQVIAAAASSSSEGDNEGKAEEEERPRRKVVAPPLRPSPLSARARALIHAAETNGEG